MSEIKELHLLKLLHVIKNNLTIETLLDIGLEYSQIAVLLTDAIEGGYVLEHESQGLVLTNAGIETLKRLSNKYYLSGSLEFLKPLDKCRIDKITANTVYLPKKKRPML